MEGAQIARILRSLRTNEAHGAWAEFLELYSPLILQVIRLFETEDDHVADCFLFVCERLSQNRFRKLRRFNLTGPASFSTWLRAVVRHLCLDWHRKEFGRQRVLQSVARLEKVDREVFRCCFLQELSLEETTSALQPQFPSITLARVAETEDRLRSALSPRQLWLLEIRRHRPIRSINVGSESNGPVSREVADPGPNPETAEVFNEQRAALHRALAQLPKADRLLLRLRFERGLTLEQIGRLARLGSPQKADRRIREILARMRQELAE